MILGGGFGPTFVDILESTVSATIISEAIKTSIIVAVREATQSSTPRDWVDVSIAIGTLLTGLGAIGFGLKSIMTIPELVNFVRLRLKQHRLRKQYPIDRVRYFLWKAKSKNPWYLIDKKRGTRHHVLPYQTVRILNWEDKVELVSEKELESYREEKDETINATRVDI